MANKTQLSIVIRAVDKATAAIRAINAKLAGAFKGVASAIGSILSKVPLIGGAIVATAGAAVAGLMSLVNHFDELGDKAEELGVGVDFLAQMRYAAERSGASVESLDQGLKGFTASLGQARAGTGKMAGFLSKVSPALLKQVKAAKSNEEAFGLMADAMVKLKDPAKRAALAQKVFGDSALAPLLAKGSKGIQELRDRYFQLAGSQAEAAAKSGEVDDAMKDFGASVDGIKAALVVGLAPALKVIVERLRNWFADNRENIKQWATDLGEKIPDAIERVVSGIEAAINKMKSLYEGYRDIRRKVFGKDAEDYAEDFYKSSTAENELEFQRGILNKGNIAQRIAYLENESANLYSKPGGMTEQDQGIIAANEKLVADLRKRFDEMLFSKGSFDKAAFASRYAMADPSKFEKYDLQFIPGLEELARTVATAKQTEAKVTIDIPSAPRGTRVKTDPQSTADVDLSVGYQMGTP